METVSILYEDYPVLVNSDDVEKYCGCILSEEIEGDSEEKVSNFLDTVHQQIYDFLIYATGDRDIKDRIITKLSSDLFLLSPNTSITILFRKNMDIKHKSIDNIYRLPTESFNPVIKK